MSGLTPQQEKFAQLVAVGNTYADAYKESYASENMAINTIYKRSSELMDNGKIKGRVKELQEEIKNRNQATLDEVLNMMAEWLRFDVKSIFKSDGTMKMLHEMSDQESSSIASYEVVELFGGSGENRAQIGELKKVKLIDKRAVADMFLKKFGAYIDNHIIKIDDLEHVRDILSKAKQI
ncbi:MAG: terminase small subunit [Bacteroidales bacterium]|nr:terminase small subunit [Bacteroidales bacterium]